jgi:hypothetical protein
MDSGEEITPALIFCDNNCKGKIIIKPPSKIIVLVGAALTVLLNTSTRFCYDL